MKHGLKRRTVYRGDDGGIWKTVRPPRSSVKVWKDETDDGVEATHVRVPISSTSEDRDGDEFTEEGLERMIEQLKSGDVPLFMDHGISAETGFQDYRALEALGGWKDGEIEDGTVYATGVLDPDHEDASTLAKRLENGIVPVGWSVGFIPNDTEPKTNDNGEQVGELFTEHDLLEVSSVGIPSNPDGVSASIAQAAKSYARSRGADVDAEAIARSITDELEKAVEKQSDDALEILESAIDTYFSETDADEATVADFMSWCNDTKEDDELEVIAALVQEALEQSDAEPGDMALQALESWVNEQYDDDEDDEEEEEADDGEDDEEEEEDDVETDDADDGDAGSTISTDDVDAIASAVGDAVGRELAEHRETLLEQLGAKETDEDEEEDEEEDDAPDSSTNAFGSEPKGIATVRSVDEDDDGDEKDVDDDETNDRAAPAGPQFQPGHN